MQNRTNALLFPFCCARMEELKKGIKHRFFSDLDRNIDSVTNLVLRNEPQTAHLFSIFNACSNEIDPSGLDAGMSQNPCQSHHIPAGTIEGSCKQVTEVVGKNL